MGLDNNNNGTLSTGAVVVLSGIGGAVTYKLGEMAVKAAYDKWWKKSDTSAQGTNQTQGTNQPQVPNQTQGTNQSQGSNQAVFAVTANDIIAMLFANKDTAALVTKAMAEGIANSMADAFKPKS